MQHLHARTPALLIMARLAPPAFPARIRAAVVRSFVLMTVIAPILAATGPAERAHAEPALAWESKNAAAVDPYVTFVREAAQRFGVPASWISAVLAIESGGDVQALSSQGAMGLMQIMPDTWTDLRTRHALGTDPYEPRDNILAGAAYLREMHDRYGSPGFLAAYNAGPGRYDDYLATGRELPPETGSYVAMLAPLIGDGQVYTTMIINRRAVAWQDAPLFAAHGQKRPVAVQPSMQTPSDRPSAGRSVAGISALAPPADGLFVRHGTARRLP